LSRRGQAAGPPRIRKFYFASTLPRRGTHTAPIGFYVAVTAGVLVGHMEKVALLCVLIATIGLLAELASAGQPRQ
jgi:hypothetical protein